MKPIIITLFCFLAVPIWAQQETFVKLTNLKDTNDYLGDFYCLKNQTYINGVYGGGIGTLYAYDLKNSLVKKRFNNIKLFKSIEKSLVYNNCIYNFGSETDTGRLVRGNLVILDSNFNIKKDTLFYNYPFLILMMGRYDSINKRLISLFTYSKHQDSLDKRQWGIIEFDSMGKVLKYLEIPDLNIPYLRAENLICTRDSGYLISGLYGQNSSYLAPFFVKLDRNYMKQWSKIVPYNSNGTFFTQFFTENVIEDKKGDLFYLGRLDYTNIGICNKTSYYYSRTIVLHLDKNGNTKKNYIHFPKNNLCFISGIPKGIFFKNDSTLLIFDNIDTSPIYHSLINEEDDTSSSYVLYYNTNRDTVVKEIISSPILYKKEINCGSRGCVMINIYAGKDLDGGYMMTGYTWIAENNSASGFVYKMDSCGYTIDQKCHLSYRVTKLSDKKYRFSLIDSLSTVCQHRWTIAGQRSMDMDVVYTFPSYGTYPVKLWGFAASSVDSIEWNFRVDSLSSSISMNILPRTRIFPNPTTDYIEIDLGEGRETSTEIHILNTLSQDLLSGRVLPKNRKHRISLLEIPQGIYFIQVGDEVYKIQKE